MTPGVAGEESDPMADVLPDLIRAIAVTEGDRVALVVDGAGRHTYRELAERAAAVSAGLRARAACRNSTTPSPEMSPEKLSST